MTTLSTGSIQIWRAAFVLLALTTASFAQVASGGAFTLEQSVLPSGGGLTNDIVNNVYTANGTVGQPAVGTQSSGPSYSFRSGFWTSSPLGPTAAAVSVGGKVITANGAGIRNIRVTLTGANGQNRTTITGSFGYFRFDEVTAGETYVLTAVGKRFEFVPQIITVSDDIVDISIAAIANF